MDEEGKTGLRLTPKRAAELILDVAIPGAWFASRDIRGSVVQRHKGEGGVESGNPEHTLRGAFQRLREAKQIEYNNQPGSGAQYRIPVEDSSQIIGPDDPNSQTPEIPEPATPSTEIADRTVGSPQGGTGYIYVICDATNQPHAQGGVVKIGKSDKPTQDRVAQQIREGAPGTRGCGLMYYTDDPSKYELILHRLLEASGRRVEGQGGSEWFRSSPDEVARLITILKNLVPHIPPH